MKKKRILSGMRPTGKLHIGHYVGALENWVALQDKYESYHLIADYHVLTTDLNTDNIYNDTIDMLIDWLAAGLDPVTSPMFRQSQIKQHTELYLIFSMLITANRLERNPTVKDQARALHIEQIIYGHLGYPVLQASDILLYKGDAVPVGAELRSDIPRAGGAGRVHEQEQCIRGGASCGREGARLGAARGVWRATDTCCRWRPDLGEVFWRMATLGVGRG